MIKATREKAVEAQRQLSDTSTLLEELALVDHTSPDGISSLAHTHFRLACNVIAQGFRLLSLGITTLDEDAPEDHSKHVHFRFPKKVPATMYLMPLCADGRAGHLYEPDPMSGDTVCVYCSTPAPDATPERAALRLVVAGKNNPWVAVGITALREAINICASEHVEDFKVRFSVGGDPRPGFTTLNHAQSVRLLKHYDEAAAAAGHPFSSDTVSTSVFYCTEHGPDLEDDDCEACVMGRALEKGHADAREDDS